MKRYLWPFFAVMASLFAWNSVERPDQGHAAVAFAVATRLRCAP